MEDHLLTVVFYLLLHVLDQIVLPGKFNELLSLLLEMGELKVQYERGKYQFVRNRVFVGKLAEHFSSLETCKQLFNTYLSIVFWYSKSFESSFVLNDIDTAQCETASLKLHGHLISIIFCVSSCASLTHFCKLLGTK